jgi:hypothetical protein
LTAYYITRKSEAQSESCARNGLPPPTPLMHKYSLEQRSRAMPFTPQRGTVLARTTPACTRGTSLPPCNSTARHRSRGRRRARRSLCVRHRHWHSSACIKPERRNRESNRSTGRQASRKAADRHIIGSKQPWPRRQQCAPLFAKSWHAVSIVAHTQASACRRYATGTGQNHHWADSQDELLPSRVLSPQQRTCELRQRPYPHLLHSGVPALQARSSPCLPRGAETVT